MKEWECMHACAVKKHEDVSKTVDGWQRKGWCLHTYQATGTSGNPSHYLLFEKGE